MGQGIMIIYRVCEIHEGKYTSFIKTPFTLKYKFGKKTSPKFGKIFCFDTLENAKLLIGENSIDVILKCKGRKAKYQRKSAAYFFGDFKYFWRNSHYKKKIRKTDTPIGTIFMDWVIPLEVVK
jgi:hypothetical protein